MLCLIYLIQSADPGVAAAPSPAKVEKGEGNRIVLITR
jgi:hypothetical protein